MPTTLNVAAGQATASADRQRGDRSLLPVAAHGQRRHNTVQIPLVRVGRPGRLARQGARRGRSRRAASTASYDKGEMLLDPGERADVVAVFPRTRPACFTLWTKTIRATGSGGSRASPDRPGRALQHDRRRRAAPTDHRRHGAALVARRRSESKRSARRPARCSIRPRSRRPRPARPNPGHQLDEHGHIKLGINRFTGEHDFSGDYTAAPRPSFPGPSGSARYAKLGDTLELTVTNTTGAHHPFHLHGFSMQPISLTDTIPGRPHQTVLETRLQAPGLRTSSRITSSATRSTCPGDTR